MTFWVIEGIVAVIGIVSVGAIIKSVNSEWDSPKKHRK